MTRLVWNAVGSRFFETGLDRGALYPTEKPGIAWNGLISVTDSPQGGGVSSYFVDGQKTRQQAAPIEHHATIEAYSYPGAFALCDGTAVPLPGVYFSEQPRSMFDLSYRTRLGNDVDGPDHAYKLHLVYNALANPSLRKRDSSTDLPKPTIFKWRLTAMPELVPGLGYSAHLTYDTKDNTREFMDALERILYGSESQAPRMPRPSELIELAGTINGNG